MTGEFAWMEMTRHLWRAGLRSANESVAYPPWSAIQCEANHFRRLVSLDRGPGWIEMNRIFV